MKRLISLIILSLFIPFIQSCNHGAKFENDPNKVLTEAEEYFLEIAFGHNAFGDQTPAIKKWDQELKLLISDTLDSNTIYNLRAALNDINKINPEFEMVLVSEEEAEEANVFLYFCDLATFIEKEPEAAQFPEKSPSGYWVHWDDEKYEIYKASLFIDPAQKTGNSLCIQTKLRKMLPAVLGLTGTSDLYQESIFHQDFRCFTPFSRLDKEVIGYFLHPEIEAGMYREEAMEVLFQLD